MRPKGCLSSSSGGTQVSHKRILIQQAFCEINAAQKASFASGVIFVLWGEKEDTSRAPHGVSTLRVFQQVHQRPRAHEGSGQASHHRLPQALMYVNNVESARLGLAVTFGQK
ncbi:transcriptional repressor general negative regulator of transcription subunit 4 [Fusarium falciforme]|nr:transcriptional repressor general negative regulator of transcription subunit 4 [Fusarium falciforme]